MHRVTDLVSKPVIWEHKATPFIVSTISPRTPEQGQTKSQRPPSLIPTSSRCPPDTRIATWNVPDQRRTKVHIPAPFAELSVIPRYRPGNTDFVGPDHADGGINAVPSVGCGTAPQGRQRHTRSDFRRGRPFSTAHARSSSKPRTKAVVVNRGLSKVSRSLMAKGKCTMRHRAILLPSCNIMWLYC